jgi:hypothetical protein
VNALADPKVGEYLEKYFVCSFQKVGTFRIVGKQKQGGNVACYFCAPDGRVLHAVAGPVDAQTLLREAKWIVDTTVSSIEKSKADGAKFKVMLRTAHAEKLRRENGLDVEPVTYDLPINPDQEGQLSFRDPSGRPLAPMLKPAPINGPDVTFRAMQENAAKSAGATRVADKLGRGWVLGNQGRVHVLLAAHSLYTIDRLYASIFEDILGERISTLPVEVVNPFPWHGRK